MSSDPIGLPNAGVVPRAPSRFFWLMGLILALVVFIGFAPTYYLRSLPAREPLSLTVHRHGLVFTLWIGLFLGQSWLVRIRPIKIHRVLGVIGAMLAVAQVYLAMAVAIPSTQRALAAGRRPLGFTPEQFLFLQIGDMVQFASLVMLAAILRRRSDRISGSCCWPR